MENLKNRIKRLHKDCIIVDAHNDMPTHVRSKRITGATKVIENNYLSDIRAGGVNVIVAAVFVSEVDNAFTEAIEQIKCLREDIEESNVYLELCTNYSQIVNAIKSEKIAIVISLEGIEPIGNDLSLMKHFYDLGLRACGICWSRKNLAADGCGFEKEEKVNKTGLTDFGVNIIKQCEQLGMIIDVTHMSEASFWESTSVAKGPIIASHTDSQYVFNIKRNFSDAQILEIARKRGVIGINGVNCIAAPIERNNDLTVLVDHIDRIKRIAGIDYVGLGLDLFPYFDSSYQQMSMIQDGVARTPLDLIRNYGELPKLTELLILKGYTDIEIKMVLGDNFMRFFENVLK